LRHSPAEGGDLHGGGAVVAECIGVHGRTPHP
jgi:hypothetical protein